MMVTVGAFEAKTQLSALLDKVEGGEEVVITRHGKAIARLVPEASIAAGRRDDIAAGFKDLRRQFTLGGLRWQDLRDVGRK